MNKIPGLYPIGTGAKERVALKGRVSAPDATQLRAPAFQPVASPVDNYTRPEIVDQGDDMMRLASALADFNPALQGFLKTKQGDPEDQRAAALKALQMADPATIDTQIREGSIPELQSHEGMLVFGERRAYEDARELTRRYNEEFDKENGDLTALFQEVTGKTYEAYGKDRAFNETYSAVMEKAFQNLTGNHGDFLTETEMTTRRDNVFTTWYDRVDFMVADGKTPAEITTSIFSDIPNNRDFLRLPPKEQQEMILTLADQHATKGNYDVAKALLEMERVDGPYKGSLMSDRNTSEQAARLMDRIAGDETREMLRIQSTEAEEQLDAAILDNVGKGTILSVTDVTIPGPDGNPKTISAEEQKKRAAKLIVSEIGAEAARRDMSPEQARAAEKAAFVGAGLEHPQWFSTMNQAHTQLSLNNTTGGALPPTTVEAFSLYRDLNSDSPLYVAQHLAPKASEFYETASVLLDAGIVRTEEEALQTANLVTTSIDSNDPLLNQKYQTIDAAVDDVIGSSGTFGVWGIRNGIPDAVNVADVRTDLVRTAKIFARAGMSNDEAMVKAAEVYKKSHLNVAGSYIKADKRMPQDFSTLVDQQLADFATKYGDEEGFGVSDLTIRETGKGTGAYVIVLRNNALAPIGSIQERTITFSSLAKLRENNRTTAIQTVVDDSQPASEGDPVWGSPAP